MVSRQSAGRVPRGQGGRERRPRVESSWNSFLKPCPEASQCESPALSQGCPLWVGDGRRPLQSLSRVFIIPKIKLSPRQDDGSVGTVVSHFRMSLRMNIFR